MPTFVDESGDTGAYSATSSPYFRMTAIWVPNRDIVEEIRNDIQALRSKLRLPNEFEFKFTKTHFQTRRHFFQTVLKHQFQFVSVSIDKSANSCIFNSSSDFHYACAVSLSASLWPIYVEEEKRVSHGINEGVYLDDNEDRKYFRLMKDKFSELTSGLVEGAKIVRKVKFAKSHQDELLQLADMVCGATGAEIDGKCSSFQLIKNRCIELIKLP